MLVYPIGTTKACHYAAQELQKSGLPLVDHPTPEVTHLLLDVPSFSDDGNLRGGGDIGAFLERLPPSVTVVGGNLNHPALAEHRCLDYLQDADYLAVNAAITADRALWVAAREMNTIYFQCPVLVLGWGRIGKCLAQLLRALGAEVTVAARKPEDLALIRALGYRAVNIYRLNSVLSRCRLIFNTVPEPILASEDCPKALKIDLASKPGILGENVLSARGLPGKFAPESAGSLMAGTLLKWIGRQ